MTKPTTMSGGSPPGADVPAGRPGPAALAPPDAPGRVLVVETSAAECRRLCEAIAAAGLEVHACADAEAAEEMATKVQPGVILARSDLPGGGGSDLVRRLLKDAAARWVPVILHGGRATAEERVAAFDLGAFDVLEPSPGAAELLARLRAAIRLRGLVDLLEHRAYRDGLTGLINRAALEDQLHRHWEASRRYGTSLSVLMIDLDRFKEINDTLGHPAGDDALRRTAAVLAGSVRSSDIVARHGGDEFVVVAPNCPRESAVTLATRFRAAIAAPPDAPDGPPPAISITLSIGIAGTDGMESARIDDLLHQADQALYLAKRSGRDAVGLYDPSAGLPRLVVRPGHSSA